MTEKIILKETCYVLPRVETFHPIAYQRSEFIWYPETAMTMLEQVSYQRYAQSIVTENPWIIASYPQENVRIWNEESGWVIPSFQTRGMSVEMAYSKILGIKQSLPSSAYDGGTAIEELSNKIKASYKNAQNR